MQKHSKILTAKSRDKFELTQHNRELVDKLASDARNYGLVLIVGSGMNGDAVPQWGKLMKTLMEQAIRRAEMEDERIAHFSKELKTWCEKELDVYAQASIVKELLGPERYRLEIQNAIYKNVQDLGELETYCRKKIERKSKKKRNCFELLRSVAELCQSDEIKGVATFNFDTLLEHAIQATPNKKRKIPRSYFGEVLPWNDKDRPKEEDIIPVYHVHGLLPPPSSIIKNQEMKVVMSYDEYFNRNSNPFSWETSSLIHLLRHYCTLWIGVSLTDWNMLRLLDAARGGRSNLRSYCVQSLPSVKSNDFCKKCKKCRTTSQCERCRTFRKVAMRFRTELFNTVGVQLIIGGDEYEEIPRTITTIHEAISKLRKK